MEIPSDLTEVRAQVGTMDGHLLASVDFQLSDAPGTMATFRLPFSFGVLEPEASEVDRVMIQIHAIGSSSTSSSKRTIFTRKALTGFVEGKSLLLPMFLASQCQTLKCNAGQTCTESGCVSEVVDETRLKESRGNESDLVIGDDSGGGDRKQTIAPSEPSPDAGVSSDAAAGSEGLKRPQLDWRLSAATGLYFSKSEVTAWQYYACVFYGDCNVIHIDQSSDDPDCNYGNTNRDNHPMNCVNWEGAKQFCAAVNGRLPSLAEWEKEHSNDNTREYPWGDTPEPSCDNTVMAWPTLDDRGCRMNSTLPVCSKTAGNNPTRLCDLAGNVWEWTTGSESAPEPLFLGGSWENSGPSSFSGSSRFSSQADTKGASLGFRCVTTSP